MPPSSNPYGCANRELGKGYFMPVRKYLPSGDFVMGTQYIPHRMSLDCRYDHRATDPRCQSCKHSGAFQRALQKALDKSNSPLDAYEQVEAFDKLKGY